MLSSTYKSFNIYSNTFADLIQDNSIKRMLMTLKIESDLWLSAVLMVVEFFQCTKQFFRVGMSFPQAFFGYVICIK